MHQLAFDEVVKKTFLTLDILSTLAPRAGVMFSLALRLYDNLLVSERFG